MNVCQSWFCLVSAGLWGLVNNAGVLQCPADSELQPLAACRRSMDVNFLAAFHLCQVFLPLLRKAQGRIVNVSSMAGRFRTGGLRQELYILCRFVHVLLLMLFKASSASMEIRVCFSFRDQTSCQTNQSD